MAEFKYAPMFQLGPDTTEYYKLTGEGVSLGEFEGHPILKVAPEALTMLANAAFRDVNFLLRPAHNQQVAKILSDPEASDNDKYVALRFLRNAEVSAKGKLPFCQDTGTAIITPRPGTSSQRSLAAFRSSPFRLGSIHSSTAFSVASSPRQSKTSVVAVPRPRAVSTSVAPCSRNQAEKSPPRLRSVMVRIRSADI